MSVMTSPGATMLTRIPFAISSLARVIASASSAALAMLYGAPLARMLATSLLEIMITSPRGRARIAGSSRAVSRCAPSAWVPITRSTSAGSVSATVSPRLAMPALCTRMSTWPCRARTVSARVSMSSPSERDARTATAVPPPPSISATASAADAPSRR